MKPLRKEIPVKTPGDTYEKYKQRCAAYGFVARPFKDWLTFELGKFGHTLGKLARCERSIPHESCQPDLFELETLRAQRGLVEAV